MNIKIIKAKTKEDCKICDKLFEKLVVYESKLDLSVLKSLKVNDMYEKFLQKENSFLAYAIDDKPVGYIFGYLNNPKGKTTNTNRINIGALFIEHKYRNLGIGKMLITEFENWATETFNNDYEIELQCYSNNKNAIKFYQNLGFNEVRKVLRKSK